MGKIKIEKQVLYFLVSFFWIVGVLQARDLRKSVEEFVFLKLLPVKVITGKILKQDKYEGFSGGSYEVKVEYKINGMTYYLEDNMPIMSSEKQVIQIIASPRKPGIARISTDGITSIFCYSISFVILLVVLSCKTCLALLNNKN